MRLKSRKDYRQRRHMRVRKKVGGTRERPRMSIAISNKHIQVQFVDDEGAITMASASTLGGGGTKNIASAGLVGRRAAEAALEKGIRNVVVDRGGHKFHGRLRAIVDAAIEAGLRTETKHNRSPFTVQRSQLKKEEGE